MTILVPLIGAFLLIGMRVRSPSVGVYLLMLLIITSVAVVWFMRG
jgi:hypothetical protein